MRETNFVEFDLVNYIILFWVQAELNSFSVILFLIFKMTIFYMEVKVSLSIFNFSLITNVPIFIFNYYINDGLFPLSIFFLPFILLLYFDISWINDEISEPMFILGSFTIFWNWFLLRIVLQPSLISFPSKLIVFYSSSSLLLNIPLYF